VAVGHYRKRGAGLYGFAVEMHDAGAALRGVAADMGAGQPQVFAQELDSQGPGVDIGVNGGAVDDHGNLCSGLGHQVSLVLRRRISTKQPIKIVPKPIIWAMAAMSNLTGRMA
jgi:hypothetical protein